MFMSEEGEFTKYREALEQTLGPLLESVWESLLEDDLVRMHDEGLQEPNPETGWRDLLKDARTRQERAKRAISEFLADGGEWELHKKSRKKSFVEEGEVEKEAEVPYVPDPKLSPMIRAM